MLLIKIETTLHHTNAFYIFDRETGEEKDVDTSELPREWLYCHDKYDIYSLAIWGRGAFCKHRDEQIYYFQVDTEHSLFLLLDTIDQRDSVSSEIFDYWRAERQETAYYLELIVNSVSQELINSYLNTIRFWCNENGTIITEDPFNIPNMPILSRSKNWGNITDDALRAMEDTKNFRKTRIYWATEFPEFEGAGGGLVAFLGANILAIISISLALFNISTSGQLKRLRVAKEIKKCRERLFKTYQIKGELCDPDPNQYMSRKNYTRVYCYKEFINQQPIAHYLVSKKKPYRLKDRLHPKYILERRPIVG